MTNDEVVMLYEKHLGREPENSEIVFDHINKFKNKKELEKNILNSSEYINKITVNAINNSIFSLINSSPTKIDLTFPNEILSKLFLKIKRQWSNLGESEPNWSVLTNQKYKRINFKKNEREFFETGRMAVETIYKFFERNSEKQQQETCIELGCGVGRITLHLAKKFKKVFAVDISKGNLEECKKNCGKQDIKNVEFVLLESPEQLINLPCCRFFFSVIVLQHNPPPIAAFFLKTILAKVETGGHALFQIPTHTPGYHFEIDTYLNEKNDKIIMEMHCLPMKEIFSILKNQNFLCLEVLADNFTGTAGSHTFFAKKD